MTNLDSFSYGWDKNINPSILSNWSWNLGRDSESDTIQNVYEDIASTEVSKTFSQADSFLDLNDSFRSSVPEEVKGSNWEIVGTTRKVYN